MREHTQACKANPLRVLGIVRCTRGSQMGEEDVRRRVATVVLDDGKNGCIARYGLSYQKRNPLPQTARTHVGS